MVAIFHQGTQVQGLQAESLPLPAQTGGRHPLLFQEGDSIVCLGS